LVLKEFASRFQRVVEALQHVLIGNVRYQVLTPLSYPDTTRQIQ
jgi:hypothetical protein